MNKVLKDTFYLTLSITNRKNNFLRPDVADYAIGELEYRGGAGKEVDIYICLLMPKEIHLVLTLREEYGKPLKNFVNAYKRYLSKNAPVVPGLKFFWEKGYIAEEIKDEVGLQKKVDEVMQIPLDAGYVPSIGRHPFITVSQLNPDSYPPSA